jgi:hypothetical protein
MNFVKWLALWPFHIRHRLIFFLFVRWDFGYCGHYWPIVPAPDDRWGWLWRNWWNKDWQGKPKYSEKTYPSATLSTTNPTWLDPGLKPGRRCGKPSTLPLELWSGLYTRITGYNSAQTTLSSSSTEHCFSTEIPDNSARLSNILSVLARSMSLYDWLFTANRSFLKHYILATTPVSYSWSLEYFHWKSHRGLPRKLFVTETITQLTMSEITKYDGR